MIPISRPSVGNEEVRLITDAVSSGWISSLGSYIDQFEREFADLCGVRHCVVTCNGTVAIQLALKCLNIGRGDEVIVPDLTFVSTANAVVHAEATPIFADIRYSDWCIDPESVESLITSRTKAIIPVHLYGHPAAMNELSALASKHNLHVIEDAAEAHGAMYLGRKVGGLGTCATFSFFGNKIITTGEGGAITTDSDDLASRARYLRGHAMSKNKRYWHSELGYNYRMTNMQAALGVAQIGQFDKFIAERDRILETYRRILEPHGVLMNPKSDGVRPVNWITCALINEISRNDRDRIISNLYSEGIDTRPFFYPQSSLPMYSQPSGKVAYDISSRGLNLPTYPGLPDSDISHICNILLNNL